MKAFAKKKKKKGQNGPLTGKIVGWFLTAEGELASLLNC